ncbi:hypothetical protein [Citrobacter sp. U14242]|uniref:hypothetical protein n=1 Tax=Citrobacter sp. U14242 TaxID=3390192 RepID=UPI00397DDA1A
MIRKLFLLLTGVLAVSWSMTGLASCTVDEIIGGDSSFNGNVTLRQRTAGNPLVTDSSGSAIIVGCDNKGGWFELNVTGVLDPAPIGDGVIKTSVDYVGVAITADVLNEDTNGMTKTVLTNGSFITRRWVIPEIDSNVPQTRKFQVVSNRIYDFWAIGPEDPKSGLFGAAKMVTLTVSGYNDVPSTSDVYGFGSNAAAIASCSIDSSALYFAMPDTKTSDFSQIGILEASKQSGTTSGGIDCDRDLNVQFTLSATDTVPGLPNVLAPEAGGAEGVGAIFKYSFRAATVGEISETRDLTLGEPFNLFDGPVGQVRRTYFYLDAYYYRFGDQVSAGHFRSTAVLNIEIQ